MRPTLGYGVALFLFAARAGAAGPTLQNFDEPGTPYSAYAFAAPTPTVVTGAACLGGGSCLHLAAAVVPQNNTIAFDSTEPVLVERVEVGFDFRIKPAGPNSRADGLGFALLDVAQPAYGTTGSVPPNGPLFAAEEPNFAGSLGVGLDIHAGAVPFEPSRNTVSIHWDGAAFAAYAIDEGVLDLAADRWIRARIIVTTSAGRSRVRVTLGFLDDGVIFDRVTDVPGMSPYVGRPLLGARSGGEAADFYIDNVQVDYRRPELHGQWGPVIPLPVVPIHTHVLPTGKVMFWDRHGDANPAHPPEWDGHPRLWDPARPDEPAGEAAMVPFDLFCGGHSFLPNGHLFVSGGHLLDHVGLPHAVTYDPFADEWTPWPDMLEGRWYPTNTALGNGDVLVVSGEKNVGSVNDVPEVFELASGTWRPLDEARRAQPLYPWMFLTPQGSVFAAGPQPEGAYLTVAGQGRWRAGPVSRNGYRSEGTAAMYEDGKILIAGGGGDLLEPPQVSTPPIRAAETIDLNVPESQRRWSDAAPMRFQRRFATATILADGKVLVTGGTSRPGNSFRGAVYAPEVWDPATNTWTVLAEMEKARLYHSTAVLLPDGSVFSGGGGHPWADDEQADHKDAEIFAPPYMFKPRPALVRAPPVVSYGEAFPVETPDAAAIQRVHWIRLSSVTHTFNQEQRLNRLTFTRGAGVLRVTAPTNRNLAPPGYYMLFILDAAGVPSRGHVVRVENETRYRLSVVKAGAGAGTVTAEDVDCGFDCEGWYAPGRVVRLRAQPNGLSDFAGWVGACTPAGHGICDVPMDRARFVTARFIPSTLTRDFDANGRPDILWRHVGNGRNRVWLMNGTTRLGQADLETVEVGWDIVAVADFNSDGKPDLVWRSRVNGAGGIWLMNGLTRTAVWPLETVSDPAWDIVGAADFNGDDRPDLVWRNRTTGANAVWYMQGNVRIGVGAIESVPGAWNIVAIGDFDGDGHPDLVWRHPVTGVAGIWLMNGVARTSVVPIPPEPDPQWEIVGAADFNADGKSDLLWRHAGNGDNRVSLTGGAVVPLPPELDLGWRIR